MSTRNLVLFGVIALTTGCAGDDGEKKVREDQCDELGAAALDELQKETATYALPGAVLGIDVPGCDRMMMAVGDSEVGLAAMRPWHAMSIGGVSQTWLAALALRQVENGALNLDTPAIWWSPSMTEATPISLADLLGHRSGLPDYADDAECLRLRWQDSKPDELIGCVADRELTRQPGDRYADTYTDAVVAGLVVQESMGVPLHDAVLTLTKHVRVEQTAYDGPGKGPWRERPHVYHRGEDVTGRWDPSFVWAGGDIVSTAGDQLTWIRALVAGDVLSDEGKARMQDFAPARNGWPAEEYGLGLERRDVHDDNGDHVVSLVGHTGDWESMAQVYYVPEWDGAVALLVNEQAGPFISAVPPIVLDHVIERVAPHVDAQ